MTELSPSTKIRAMKHWQMLGDQVAAVARRRSERLSSVATNYTPRKKKHEVNRRLTMPINLRKTSLLEKYTSPQNSRAGGSDNPQSRVTIHHKKPIKNAAENTKKDVKKLVAFFESFAAKDGAENLVKVRGGGDKVKTAVRRHTTVIYPGKK